MGGSGYRVVPVLRGPRPVRRYLAALTMVTAMAETGRTHTMADNTRVTVKRAQQLSELLTDAEDALSRASDAVAELTESEVRGEDRDERSEELSEALGELETAVQALRDKMPKGAA